MEHTFENLINIIFVDSPKPPCTYNLSLPRDNSSTMFQLLMTLLISGAKKLYGENITPSDISEDQFEELKRYIESVGYVIKYNYKNNNKNNNQIEQTDIAPKIINIWFEQYIPLTDCHGRRVIS
jgi:hypothetical protein